MKVPCLQRYTSRQWQVVFGGAANLSRKGRFFLNHPNSALSVNLVVVTFSLVIQSETSEPHRPTNNFS